MLDPREYKDWQIAAEAEKRLPSVETFREQLGLLPEEIIPFGNPETRLPKDYETVERPSRREVHRSHSHYPHAFGGRKIHHCFRAH